MGAPLAEWLYQHLGIAPVVLSLGATGMGKLGFVGQSESAGPGEEGRTLGRKREEFAGAFGFGLKRGEFDHLATDTSLVMKRHHTE